MEWIDLWELGLTGFGVVSTGTFITKTIVSDSIDGGSVLVAEAMDCVHGNSGCDKGVRTCDFSTYSTTSLFWYVLFFKLRFETTS